MDFILSIILCIVSLIAGTFAVIFGIKVKNNKPKTQSGTIKETIKENKETIVESKAEDTKRDELVDKTKTTIEENKKLMEEINAQINNL